MLDVAASYEALHSSRVVFAVKRDLVRVIGPGASPYLASQCSQDLEGLEVGSGRETLLLSPQGKIDAYGTVVRFGEEDFAFVVDGGAGEAAMERLRRFKLRVKAELSLQHVENRILADNDFDAPIEISGALATVPLDWPGVCLVEIFGSSIALSPDVVLGDVAALEVTRLEAGIPKIGAELTEKTIPQETDLVPRTVSFTKGCFPGQELVARIDSRGNRVPRHLRGLVASPGVAITLGEEIVLDDKVVGAITSVAHHPKLDCDIALGYVRREVDAPSTAVLRRADYEEHVIDIRELPLQVD